ncbi:MAG: hypothetical protein OXP08_11875 [bacterium]|nr:hypothetical protein [bacterium]
MRGMVELRQEQFTGREGDRVDYLATYVVGEDGGSQRLNVKALRLLDGATVELEPRATLSGKSEVVLLGYEAPKA